MKNLNKINTMNELLSVEHFSVSFTQNYGLWKSRELPVIQDLSLTVHAGEMVAVVGSSGSGKSLLAHGIMGLLPRNASWQGTLLYRGQELNQKLWKTLRGRKLVLVPQSVSYLDPLMNVGEQIRNGRKDKETKKNAAQVLARYGLKEETEKLYPFELSGGMTRRILISTAVMESPDLVIADEPTPGLHLEAAKRVLSHFREIADQGAGVLLITHDLPLALETADRIIVLYAGTTMEEAAAEDFQSEARLRHPYTKALYRAMPEHAFQETPGTQPFASDLPPGCPYAPRCEYSEDLCKHPANYRSVKGGKVRCWKSI